MELITTALQNKDVFTTLITLWIFTWIVVPLLNKQSKQQANALSKIAESFDKFQSSFSEHMLEDARQLTAIFDKLEEHKREANRQFSDIKENSYKRILSTEQTIDIFKSQMWYVSSKKLDFIRNIILNNHIKDNEVNIRNKLVSWLLALSDEYLIKFNWYKTPIWSLTKWLQANFREEEFNKLIDDIIVIIYKDYGWNENDNTLSKINDISMLMKTLQVWLANKLRWDLMRCN